MFDDTNVARLERILRGKRLGFTKDEIQGLMTSNEGVPRASGTWRGVARHCNASLRSARQTTTGSGLPRLEPFLQAIAFKLARGLLEFFGCSRNPMSDFCDLGHLAVHSSSVAAIASRLCRKLDELGYANEVERLWHLPGNLHNSQERYHKSDFLPSERVIYFSSTTWAALMSNLDKYTTACFVRLGEARTIADSLRHDNALHRLAMQAVFVLEDAHETLSRLSDREGPKPAGEVGRPVILP